MGNVWAWAGGQPSVCRPAVCRPAVYRPAVGRPSCGRPSAVCRLQAAGRPAIGRLQLEAVKNSSCLSPTSAPGRDKRARALPGIFGGLKRSGAFDAVWPPAMTKMRHANLHGLHLAAPAASRAVCGCVRVCVPVCVSLCVCAFMFVVLLCLCFCVCLCACMPVCVSVCVCVCVPLSVRVRAVWQK